MFRQTFLHLFAVAPLLGLAIGAPAARAEATEKISGPYTHENLSVYLVHGKSADGPVPLTLDEALAKGLVEVHETGTVSQLVIQNKSGEAEVFVHAGDIVKGGKQDRVVTASFLLPPKSKEVTIPVYCVEAGRWAPRGSESAAKFSAAAEMLPTREAKLAMRMAPAPTATGSLRRTEVLRNPDTRPLPQSDQNQAANRLSSLLERNTSTEERPAGGQSEVWRNVAEIQAKLSSKLKAKVNSEASASSLQLALENKELAARQKRYMTALLNVGKGDADIIGYAIAVNGKIASADVYASNALFRKLWPRLLKTAATEAISAEEVRDAQAPDVTAVQSFIAKPVDIKPEAVSPVDGISVNARAADSFYDTETYRGDQFLHRSKLAR